MFANLNGGLDLPPCDDDGLGGGLGGGGTRTLKFRYVYQYLDHLGNVRLSYSDLDKSGDIDNKTEILEEHNYYPFGLKHKGYNQIVNTDNEHKWRYSGTEFDGGFDLNLYDSKARMYDQATGRFASIDPHASRYASHSTYNYAFSNPVLFGDPTGKDNMIYLIVAGDFSRKTAQAIVDKANYYLEYILKVERRVTLFGGGNFNRHNLDGNDNWGVIGDDRDAIINTASKINKAFTDYLEAGEDWQKWSKKTAKSQVEVEEAIYPPRPATKDGSLLGNGFIMDHNMTKEVLNSYKGGIKQTYVESSAITVLHADGHNFIHESAPGEHAYGHTTLGLLEGGNNSVDGLYNSLAANGLGILTPEKNEDYLTGLKNAYGNRPAHDNYKFNSRFKLPPVSSFIQGGLRLLFKKAIQKKVKRMPFRYH